MVNVAIFYGGKSPEHDISIITGLQTINNLDKSKYNIIPIYIDKGNSWKIVKDANNVNSYCMDKLNYINLATGFIDKYIIKQTKFGLKKHIQIDVAINCCHGAEGENGSLSGILKIADIPFACCDTLSSAICMDKIIMKDVFSNNGYNIVPYSWFDKKEYVLNQQNVLFKVQEIGFPLIVKPCSTGSSIGISFCKDIIELKNAIDIAFEFDDYVIVEKAIENLREFNQAVMSYNGTKILSVIEEPQVNNMLSFDDKYSNSKLSESKRIINVSLSDELVEKINNTTLSCYDTFRCNGIVRIDYLYDNKSGELYINELNTNPGSLAFYLFKDKKITFAEMLDMTISNAFFEHNKNIKTTYESNVLKNYGKKNGTKANAIKLK